MADLALNPPGPHDKTPWATCLEPLHETFWQRFRWFCDLCLDRYGIQQFVLSGNRTFAEQVYLRQQNCGPTDWDVYHKAPMSCSPATAIPGTSNHEGGKAIDCGYGYNDVRGDMIATAHECGLRYAVRGEDWHLEEDPNNLTPIPDKYTTPHPNPPTQEEEMARSNIAQRASDGMQFEAIIRRNGKFEYRFTTPAAPLLSNNDWVSVVANGGPVVPFGFDTVNVFLYDERFHIECRSEDVAAVVGQADYGYPIKMDPGLYPSKL